MSSEVLLNTLQCSTVLIEVRIAGTWKGQAKKIICTLVLTPHVGFPPLLRPDTERPSASRAKKKTHRHHQDSTSR